MGAADAPVIHGIISTTLTPTPYTYMHRNMKQTTPCPHRILAVAARESISAASFKIVDASVSDSTASGPSLTSHPSRSPRVTNTGTEASAIH